MYDPATGRFLSRDPVFGSVVDPLSLNRFSYVGNDPTNLTDPSGLCPSQNQILGDFCFSYDEKTRQLQVNPICAETLDEGIAAEPVPLPVPVIGGGPVFALPPALPPSNLATFYQEVVVPAGTQFQIGIANEAFGEAGGGFQIELLERIPPESYGPWTPLQP